MAPYMESSGASSPLATDGEIPAVYPTKVKDAHVSEAPVGLEGASLGVKAAPEEASTPVSYNAEYALKPRKLRIITIGAGFSGLMLAHKFQHRFPELQEFVEHTIYESRSDIGGTWLVNTYPGVQCDVPSHIYVSLCCVLPDMF